MMLGWASLKKLRFDLPAPPRLSTFAFAPAVCSPYALAAALYLVIATVTYMAKVAQINSKQGSASRFVYKCAKLRHPNANFLVDAFQNRAPLKTPQTRLSDFLTTSLLIVNERVIKSE
jgi:hypothetical protein